MGFVFKLQSNTYAVNGRIFGLLPSGVAKLNWAIPTPATQLHMWHAPSFLFWMLLVCAKRNILLKVIWNTVEIFSGDILNCNHTQNITQMLPFHIKSTIMSPTWFSYKLSIKYSSLIPCLFPVGPKYPLHASVVVSYIYINKTKSPVWWLLSRNRGLRHQASSVVSFILSMNCSSLIKYFSLGTWVYPLAVTRD